MVTVLIVEDSMSDQQIYRDTLAGIDYLHVLEAESGEAALRLLESQMVDVFFLDVELPGINGFALARKIRAMPDYVMAPILFITGYSKNQLDAFREFHCYNYIVKPFDPMDFAERVLELIKEFKLSKTVLPQGRRKAALLMTDQGLTPVMTDQIVFAEVRLMDCYLQLQEGQLKLSRTSLASVMKEIDEGFFVQCHKSFAVNVHYIGRIEKIDYRSWRIHMKCGDQVIDMSGKFKDQVDLAMQLCLEKEKG